MVSKILKRTANLFYKVAKRVEGPTAKTELDRWFEANGDRTLRLDYDLNENSVVFDVGGYEGQWASDLFSRYRSTIYIFEPFSLYAENISRRFARNPKIFVNAFGLSNINQTSRLNVSDDSSSVFKPSSETVEIELIKASEFIRNHEIGFIDLMKINIEGGEYELLDDLISEQLLSCIGNIQVQFHNFVPNALARMNNIRLALQKTHELTYQFEFVWENWTLRK